MESKYKINKIDVVLWVLLILVWALVRIPFYLETIVNVDVSLTVAETISRFFPNTPLYGSPDEGFVKFLFVLPTLFFTRDFACFAFMPLFFSFLSIVLSFRLAKIWFDKRVAFFSACLLVLSLWHADYSVYIELYTLYNCIGLLWLLSFNRFVKKQDKKSILIFWTFAVLAFYTYTPFVLFLLVFALWLHWTRQKESLKTFFKGFLLFVVLLFFHLFKMIKVFTYRRIVGSQLTDSDFFESLEFVFFSKDNYYLFLILIVAGFFLYRGKKNHRFFLLLFGLFIISAGFFLAADIFKLAFFPRYLFFVYPFWVMLVGATLGFIAKSRLSVAVLLFLLSCFPAGVKTYHYYSGKLQVAETRYIHSQKNFYLRVDDLVKDYAKEGDVFFVDSFIVLLGLQHYMDVDNNYPLSMFSFLDYMAISFDYENKYKFIHAGDAKKEAYISKLKKHYPRVWIVEWDTGVFTKSVDKKKIKAVFEIEGAKVYLIEYAVDQYDDILEKIDKAELHYPFERH